jgi:hypothetical protein
VEPDAVGDLSDDSGHNTTRLSGTIAATLFSVARWVVNAGRGAYLGIVILAAGCIGAKLLWQAKDSSSQNQLIEFVCYVISFTSLAFVPFGLRKILDQGSGHLAQLGLDTYFLSRGELRALNFWTLFVIIFSGIICIFGLNDIIRQGILGSTPIGGNYIGTHPGHTQFGRIAAGLHLIVIIPAVLVWALSMKVGAVLARSAIRRVIHIAEMNDMSPNIPERWRDEVVIPTMRLATNTLPTLSHGWGPQLVVTMTAVWVMSFGTMCEGFDNGKITTFMLSILLSLVPLILAIDLADTSTQCDHLRTGNHSPTKMNQSLRCFAGFISERVVACSTERDSN